MARTLASKEALDAEVAARVAQSATFASQFDGTGKTAIEINTWLATPNPLGIKRLVGTCTPADTLLVPSGTYLDATGATITLGGTAYKNILRNTNALSGSDSNITVVGGTWDYASSTKGGADSSARHGLYFRKVTNLRVVAPTVKDAKKYAIVVLDCTDWHVDRPYFPATLSDGVHVNGPSLRGRITNPMGTTGDDLVSLTAKDYAQYNDTEGDISDVVVDGLTGVNAYNLLKIIGGVTGGTTYKVRDVTARGARGTAANYGANIIDDGTGASDLGGILLDDWAVTTPTGNPVFNINCTAGRDITIRDFDFRNAGAGNIISIGSLAVLKSLRVIGGKALGALGNVWVVSSAGATVDHVSIDGVHQLNSGNTGGLFLLSGGNTKRLSVGAGCHISTVGAVIRSTSTTAPVMLVSVGAMQAFNTSVFVQSTSPVTVTVGGAIIDAFTNYLRLTGTTSTGSRLAGVLSGLRAGGAGVYRDGTQAVSVNGAGIATDISILTPTDGDQALNSNASAATGVGAVVYSTAATKWKHLYSGVTT